MPESADDLGLLSLQADFPPVSTAEWEATIENDLKGANYDEALVWRTEEGIAVRPYYRRDDLKGLGDLGDRAGQGWEEAQDWLPPAGAIRADSLREAGATAVQELGFALAEAVEKLSAAINSGMTVEAAASEIVFVYATGSNYFFEIAKLRAARRLWSMAVKAFGPADAKPAIARIHVRTAKWNKDVADPCTNLVRATTEALSAVIGGCDSLTVETVGFDPHLALSVQRILREEAYLDRVVDPAAGSYYVEVLTDAIGREAWKIFQDIESARTK